ncbi:MAG TPA: NAD(P)/FAD-dependent oxidoreductase [Bacteroidales bacterium]|nr:NAD(P)/FAD-dependent oxidoreductase [Bacteroidales bacterium]
MKQIVVVGGGISGLTCTAYLARAGYKVLLLEKNNEFGGLVSSIEHNGFTFEAGVRALVNAGIILPMLNDLGIQLEMVPNKVSIGIEDKIIHVDSKEDVEKYREMLIDLYSGSSNEIYNFIRRMQKITGYVDTMYKIDNPVFRDLKKDREFLLKKLLPWLPRFLLTLQKINMLNEPVEQYVARFISDPSVRDIITQHFFKSTPAFFALGYFAIYAEYYYPIGGVGRLAEAVQKKALELKAELKTGKLIREVNAAEQYVIDQNGAKYKYDYLVWAADLPTFYDIVNLNGLPLNIKNKVLNLKSKFRKARSSESVFSLYLEVDLPLEYFGRISQGHFFYTPSKKGLGTIHTSELESLPEDFAYNNKDEILSWLDRFLEHNTFEISIPGLRDKNLVPEGKTGLIISFLTEFWLFEKVKQAGWYEEFKDIIENKIIDILSRTIYNGLKERIEHRFSFTPLSIKKRIASTNGAIVGWSFERDVPAVSNMLKVNQSVLTPLPNTFQTGQWTYSPAGVPMAILTGKLAADKLLKCK